MLQGCDGPELTPPRVLARFDLDRRQISAGFQTQVLNWRSGRVYLVLVEQDAADVELVLRDRDGAELERNNLQGDYVRVVESLAFQPAADADVRLSLEPRLTSHRARISVRILELADDTAPDRARIHAELALSEAQRVDDAADVGTWRLRRAALIGARTQFGRLGLERRRAAATFAEAVLSYWYLLNGHCSARLAGTAAQQWARLEDPLKQAAALTLRGMALMEPAAADSRELIQRNRRAAQRQLAESLMVQIDRQAWPDAALTANNVAIALHRDRRLAEAAETYQESIEHARGAGAATVAAMATQNLGSLYAETGELNRAARLFASILEQPPANLSSWLQGYLWLKLGRTRALLGQWNLAIEAFEKAEALHPLATDRAQSLAALAGAYLALGHPQRARRYATQAQALRAEIQERATLDALDAIQLELLVVEQPPAAAVEALEQRLAATTVPWARALIATMLADLQLELNQPSAALKLAQQAVQAAIQHADERVLVESYLRLARIALVQPDDHLEPARRALREVADFIRREGSATLRSEYEAASALLLRYQGDWAGALEKSERALRELWDGRHEIGPVELRSGFMQSQRRLAGLHVELLLQAGSEVAQPEQAPPLNALALAWEDAMRGATLLEHRLQRATIRRDADPALRQRLATAEDQLRRLSQEPGAAGELESLMRQRDRLHARIAGIDLNLPGPEGVAPEHFQRRIPDGTTMLYYRLGRQRSHAWLVDADRFELVALAPAPEIEAAVRAALETARFPPTGAPNDAARRVSELILAPIIGRVGNPRVVLGISGALQLVPFAALPLPAGGYFGDRHTLEVVPTMSVATPASGLKRSLEALVVGAPAYRRAGGPGATRSGPDGPLPGSEMESRRIAGMFDPDRVVLLTGVEASIGNLISHLDRRPRILHIAAHAEARPDFPQLSRLKLTRFDRDGRDLGSDSLLTGLDIARHRFDSALIVLSACETAAGPRFDLQAVGGLALEFIASGAGAVLASHWRVPDQATGELMVAFYDQLINHGVDPALALARAQQRVRALQPSWRDPYYWGGWTLYRVGIDHAGSPGDTGGDHETEPR